MTSPSISRTFFIPGRVTPPCSTCSSREALFFCFFVWGRCLSVQLWLSSCSQSSYLSLSRKGMTGMCLAPVRFLSLWIQLLLVDCISGSIQHLCFALWPISFAVKFHSCFSICQDTFLFKECIALYIWTTFDLSTIGGHLAYTHTHTYTTT